MSDCRKEPGSIPEVHFFPTTTKLHAWECKLYAILALNEKGVTKLFEGTSRGTSTSDVFHENYPNCPPQKS
jgi:hypothetical protein